ncbi:hypothetical protein NO108_04893 [Planktothrix rubescens]|nr:hypothetical protein NO108_04893 [Planktothrix rubescens]
MRDELDARDKQLSDTVAEIEKFREDQHSLKGEVKDRGSAIVTLQTELEKVRGEVLERDVAIAKLESELAAGGDKQLTLFPPEPTQTPTPEPTPIPTPELIKPESSPKPKAKAKAKSNPFPEGSLSTMELIAHINQKFPGDNIEYSDLNDCLTMKNGKPKSQNLSDYKAKYGFEFLGKFSGQRRFKIV